MMPNYSFKRWSCLAIVTFSIGSVCTANDLTINNNWDEEIVFYAVAAGGEWKDAMQVTVPPHDGATLELDPTTEYSLGLLTADHWFLQSTSGFQLHASATGQVPYSISACVVIGWKIVSKKFPPTNRFVSAWTPVDLEVNKGVLSR